MMRTIIILILCILLLGCTGERVVQEDSVQEEPVDQIDCNDQPLFARLMCLDLSGQNVDETICEDYKSDISKEACLAAVKKEFKDCTMVSEFWIENDRLKFGEWLLENKYSDYSGPLPVKFVDECSMVRADFTGNIDECLHIQDSMFLQACAIGVASKLNDPFACDSLVEENEYMEDIALSCRLFVILSQEDPEKCELLHTNNKDTCFYHLSRSLVDIELCRKVIDPVMRGVCIDEIALVTDNMELCEEIPKPHFVNICYKNFAEEKNDVSICNKIDDEDTKEWCIEIVGYNGN